MQNILIFILIFSTCYMRVQTAKKLDTTTYAVPCNTRYPYGDEHQFNVNDIENDTNRVHCSEPIPMEKLKGKCPSDEQDTAKLMEPYITCPGFAVFPPPHEIIFSGGDRQEPQVQCKRCDLQLTSDGTAVIVECFQCLDTASLKKPANRTERNILYKTYFIQIANYTTVDVTGRENFEA